MSSLARRFEVQFAAFGHGLNRVDHHVQHGLFEQVPIHSHLDSFGLQKNTHLNVGCRSLRPRQIDDLLNQFLQRNVVHPQLDRAREIEEGTYYAVQPSEFRAK